MNKKSDRVSERAFDDGWGLPSRGNQLESTVGSFSERALKAWDYARCQRPDGTVYGTAGRCKKGVEIKRVETGYFTVHDHNGNGVGSIMAETAFTGGGGIRRTGTAAKYTARVYVPGEKEPRTKSGLTLQQAKNQAKEWLGEKPTVSPAKAAGVVTPRKLKNMKADLEDLNDDLRVAREDGRKQKAESLLSRIRELEQQIAQAERQGG